jgi:hypothetical protein
VREFVPPAETLEKTLESNRGRRDTMEDNGTLIHAGNSVFYARTESLPSGTGDVAPESGIFYFWNTNLVFWFSPPRLALLYILLVVILSTLVFSEIDCLLLVRTVQ